MGTLTLIGVTYGRPVWALWSWGLAVILMLIIRPLWIIDLSFQLSVLASLGLILFGTSDSQGEYRNDETGPARLKEFIEGNIRLTLAAQVFTIPVLLVTFGRISLIAPLTNILILWTLPILTVLGIVMIVLGMIFFPLGQIFSWIIWAFLEYDISMIFLTSQIPFAGFQW